MDSSKNKYYTLVNSVFDKAMVNWTSAVSNTVAALVQLAVLLHREHAKERQKMEEIHLWKMIKIQGRKSSRQMLEGQSEDSSICSLAILFHPVDNQSLFKQRKCILFNFVNTILTRNLWKDEKTHSQISLKKKVIWDLLYLSYF